MQRTVNAASSRLLLETPFRSVYYDEGENILISHWTNMDGILTEEIFRKEAYKLVDLIKEYKPTGLLLDNLHLNFMLTPQLQKWYAEEFAATWSSILNRIAIVIPHDLLVHISIEEVGKLAAAMGYETINHKFFDNNEEAVKWLIGTR